MLIIFSICSTPVWTLDQYDTYKKKLAKIKDDDVAGHYKLGLWCIKNRLKKLAKAQFEKVIKLDSNHAGARKKLGHVKWKEKWIIKEKKK